MKTKEQIEKEYNSQFVSYIQDNGTPYYGETHKAVWQFISEIVDERDVLQIKLEGAKNILKKLNYPF